LVLKKGMGVDRCIVVRIIINSRAVVEVEVGDAGREAGVEGEGGGLRVRASIVLWYLHSWWIRV
jgi:hypothetical protein